MKTVRFARFLLSLACVGMLSATIAYGREPGTSDDSVALPIAGGKEVRIANPYRCGFDVKTSAHGFVLTSKDWVAEIDPVSAPAESPSTPVELTSFAAPGQYEPLSLVIYAQQDLRELTVHASDLKCAAGTIAAENIEVRWGMRGPKRKRYHFPPTAFAVVTTFLPLMGTLDVPAGNFREVFLIVHVPGNTAPGKYEGRVSVAAKGLPAAQTSVTVQVLPLSLGKPAGKLFGVYYGLRNRLKTPDIARVEIHDMRAHGVDMLHPNLGIGYRRLASGEVEVDYSTLEQGLAFLHEEHFAGRVVVDTGLASLALRLGHRPVKGAVDATLDTDQRFQQVANQAIEGLKPIQQRYPQMEIVLTHLDEVFNEGRLPLYLQLTRAAKQVPGFRHYITFHTINAQADEMRRQIAPYVDLRCHHSNYTFDWWLARGHTLAEYAEELARDHAEAGIYFNPVGAYTDAERFRVVNGLYMWLCPFKFQISWTYQDVRGDPFNDLDEKVSDTTFAVFLPEQGVLMPAKIWEGYRQGINDLRYLSTLESLIAESGDRKPNEVAAARRWLESLRARIPDPRKLQGDDRTKLGTPEEPPLIHAIQQEFSRGGLQRMRREAAEHILSILGTTPGR